MELCNAKFSWLAICLMSITVSIKSYKLEYNVSATVSSSIQKYDASVIVSSPCGCSKQNQCKCELSKRTGRCTVTCDGRKFRKKLTSIPKIPGETQELIFINNILSKLNETTMKTINHNLTHLNLSNNNIKCLEKTTFRPLKYLQVLDMSKNNDLNIENVSQSFFFVSKSIQKVSLNHMLWHLPINKSDMFDGLKNSGITNIELSHSYLFPFNGSWFENLTTLNSLDISWNSIQNDKLSFNGLSNLTFLSFIGNYINYVPDFCKYRNGPRNLKTLFLSNTRLGNLYNLQNNTRCLVSLEKLYINGISVPVIPNNAFSELKMLEELSMVRLSTGTKRVEKYAFNSSSLTTLKFSKCDGFAFSKESLKTKYFSPEIFALSRNLTKIDLSYNTVQFDVKNIKDMFDPLTNLKNITLIGMGLTEIPTSFFGRFNQLEGIVLDNNLISAWSDGGAIFGGVRRLKLLSLKNNKISHITSNTFPKIVRDSLQILDLTNNRFTCTCELLWFRNWLDKTNIDIVGKNDYKCDTNMLLKNFNPNSFDCSDTLLIIMVSSCCGVGFLTLSTICIYCCRWRIRFQLYKIRSRSRYHTITDEDDYKYTAYIIYCYDDLTWVKDNLIPKLEGELGSKLCIPHRDFELGSVIADNIVDHMNVSKTVLPILSNNFSRNEWCLFQLAVARSKLSKEGTVSILPILLEEIKFKNMNASIYSMINLTSYAAWSTDENAVVLFWDQVKCFVST